MSNGNTPASPINFIPGSGVWERTGLTKREYFAGLALQGILSNAAILREHGLQADTTATNAVEFADALLAALS